MKVHKVGVAFVNNPLVRALVQAFLAFNSTVSIVMRTDQTLTLKFVLVAFMVWHLQFELDVIANVGVLPFEELDTYGKLTSTHLFMKQVLIVFSIIHWST